MFDERYADVFDGDASWRAMEAGGGLTYAGTAARPTSSNPPYFEGMTKTPRAITDIVGARMLGLFGDSITTDHISPAGSIKRDSPAGEYLIEHQRGAGRIQSYGARRGNHEVMMRGTFANMRIKN